MDSRQIALINYKELGHTPVSYSALKKLRIGGINEFYRYKERETEDEYSKALDLGTLIDEYLLNQTEFSDKYVINDVESPSSQNQQKFCQLLAHSGYSIEDAYRESYSCKSKSDKKVVEEANNLHNELADYIHFIRETVGKEYYSKDDSYALNQIRMNISGHKEARKLFPWVTMSGIPSNAEIRTHVQLSTSYEGFEIRGEIDLLYIDHNEKKVYLYDLKSTSSYLQNFEYEARNYKYFMQLYLYGIMVKNEILPEFEGYTMATPRFLVVRTQGSYNVGILTPDPKQFILEKKNLIEDFNTLEWHYANKKFKYSKEYYQGDGVETLDYVEDVKSWREQTDQALSEIRGTIS